MLSSWCSWIFPYKILLSTTSQNTVIVGPRKMNFRSELLLHTTPFFLTYCYKNATTESQREHLHTVQQVDFLTFSLASFLVF